MSLSVELNAIEISKSYNNVKLFDAWSYSFLKGNIIGIAGANGSGKSTLMKVLAGIVKPDKGEVELMIDGKRIDKGEYFKHIGLVAPYLNLYSELSILEHLKLIEKIKLCKPDYAAFDELLDRFDLVAFRDKPTKVYSSGMLQKCRLILALISQPRLMLLDEPFSNLDESSIEKLSLIIREYCESSIIIIASNDSRELKLCQNILKL